MEDPSIIRVLLIGDQHFQVSNVPQVEIFINKLSELLSNEQYDLIVSLGDLLHTHERVHTLALKKATEYLDILRCYAPTYVLVGNHDYCNNSQFLSDNHWLNSFKGWGNLIVVDKIHIIKIKNEQFTLTPYVPNGRFVEALNTTPGWMESRCIFAHQELSGGKMGAVISECEEWKIEYPPVKSGHLHDEQIVQENLEYTGSCMQHAFGESGNKTLLELTIQDGKITPRRINLQLPTRQILHLKMEDMEEFKFETLNEEVKYKISISGDTEEFKSFTKSQLYKELTKKNIKVVFKNTRAEILAQKENYMKTLANKIEGGNLQGNFVDILRATIEEEDSILLNDLFTTIVLQQKGKDPSELDDAEIEINF